MDCLHDQLAGDPSLHSQSYLRNHITGVGPDDMGAENVVSLWYQQSF